MSNDVIRWFQRGVCVWLALYMLVVLVAGEAVWSAAPVPLFTSKMPWLVKLQALIAGLGPEHCMVASAVLLSCAVALLREHNTWLALITWVLFRFINHRMWLASNGGVQVMENMLLWAALMGPAAADGVRRSAFWAARLQLLLAYAVAAAHKFTGTTWLDGTAFALVAMDPDFHLGWLAGSATLCSLLTYAVLTFMGLFPLAVWWSPSRRIFLVAGVLFHLATAVFMDIPQMGLAFVACYAIWLTEEEAKTLGTEWRRLLPVLKP